MLIDGQLALLPLCLKTFCLLGGELLAVALTTKGQKLNLGGLRIKIVKLRFNIMEILYFLLGWWVFGILAVCWCYRWRMKGLFTTALLYGIAGPLIILPAIRVRNDV